MSLVWTRPANRVSPHLCRAAEAEAGMVRATSAAAARARRQARAIMGDQYPAWSELERPLVHEGEVVRADGVLAGGHDEGRCRMVGPRELAAPANPLALRGG